MKELLEFYGIDGVEYSMQPFGSGLINDTWLVSNHVHQYIFQKINTTVFKHPEYIAANVAYIKQYIDRNFPDYLFPATIPNQLGESITNDAKGNYYRLMPYIQGSHSMDVVTTKNEAYEAARQFGKFTKILVGLDIKQLNITLPDFHNLSLRYHQFLSAIKNGNAKRIQRSTTLINYLSGQSAIVHTYEKIISTKDFRKRVTHHDTKINNVLFDRNNKGLCVIDLDTIMPGYFISDVGDMMRTYLSPVSEDETDLTRIGIRDDIMEAIVAGYGEEMKDELSSTEKDYFFYAGEFMIYMQAIRFLTDYLLDDIYYGASYEQQNFDRAANQAQLLKCYLQKSKKHFNSHFPSTEIFY